MQRNEDLCLHPWLSYHGYMFGFENLIVIDHGSDSSSVKATLTLFERRGVKVVPLPASADYREKGAFVSAALARADATGLYDLLFPLDCDEFVVMRDRTGRPNCAKDSLLSYLGSLVGESAPLLVEENFLNSLNNPEGFWALPYQKIFFAGGHSGAVDHGSHSCRSRPEPPLPTRVVYAHYHHKPFAIQLAMSREKLRPYVDVDDPAALASFQGIGRHLVSHMLKTEDEYMAIMTGGSVRFPDLPALFEKLGIDPSFCNG